MKLLKCLTSSKISPLFRAIGSGEGRYSRTSWGGFILNIQETSKCKCVQEITWRGWMGFFPLWRRLHICLDGEIGRMVSIWSSISISSRINFLFTMQILLGLSKTSSNGSIAGGGDILQQMLMLMLMPVWGKLSNTDSTDLSFKLFWSIEGLFTSSGKTFSGGCGGESSKTPFLLSLSSCRVRGRWNVSTGGSKWFNILFTGYSFWKLMISTTSTDGGWGGEGNKSLNLQTKSSSELFALGTRMKISSLLMLCSTKALETHWGSL